MHDTITIIPTTSQTGYLGLYAGDYSSIVNGAGTSLQFLATPSSPYPLGNINFIKNDSTLAGSAYMAISIQNGSGPNPLLYGVPTNSLGNMNLYPPDNKINLGVLGGQFSSVGTFGIKNNDTNTDLTISATGGKWITLNTSNSNTNGSYPASTYQNPTCSIGWNFSAGQGETDFMDNYGGGFYFYTRNSPNTSFILASFNTNTAQVYIFGGQVAYTNLSGWVNTSDAREKTNIRDVDTSHSLNKILACSPKYYNRIFPENVEEKGITDKTLIGLLAQDVLTFNEGSVSTWKNDKGEDRYGINYTDFTIHLIGAVQEQNKIITALQSQIQEQDAKINALQSQFDELMKKINIV